VIAPSALAYAQESGNEPLSSMSSCLLSTPRTPRPCSMTSLPGQASRRWINMRPDHEHAQRPHECPTSQLVPVTAAIMMGDPEYRSLSGAKGGRTAARRCALLRQPEKYSWCHPIRRSSFSLFSKKLLHAGSGGHGGETHVKKVDEGERRPRRIAINSGSVAPGMW